MTEHRPYFFTSADSEQAVLQIMLARRARARVFGSDLFSDPGWDVLLSLFLAGHRQQRRTLGQLSRHISLSPKLTSRWVDTLNQYGLVRLRPDPGDGRCIFVELSGKGMEAMREWLETCRGFEIDSNNCVIDLLSRIQDNRD